MIPRLNRVRVADSETMRTMTEGAGFPFTGPRVCPSPCSAEIAYHPAGSDGIRFGECIRCGSKYTQELKVDYTPGGIIFSWAR